MHLISIALVFASGAARAGEFLYQAPAGTAAATVQAGYRQTQTFRTKVDGDDPQSGGGLYRSGVKGDYGVNERISLGGGLTYSDLVIKSGATRHYQGLEPLNLYVRAREPVGGANLLFGLDLSIGLEKPRTNKQAANRTVGDPIDGLSQTLVVTPYLGAAVNVGPGRAGATLAYDVYRGDTEFSSTNGSARTNYTLIRGNRSTLTAFYEGFVGTTLLGADVGWIKQWETKVKAESRSGVFPGYGLFRVDVYANLALSPSASLVPTLTSISTLFSDTSEDTSDARLTIAFRQTF